MADTRRMDLYADEVGSRRRRSELDERVAIAKTDLQHARRGTPEHAIEVERRGGIRDAMARQQLLERAPLRPRHAPRPQYVASDRLSRCVHAGASRSAVSEIGRAHV